MVAVAATTDYKLSTANRTKVAAKVGVTREHISQILSGRKEPSLPVAAKLAKETGVSLDEFYRFWAGMRAA